MSTRPNDAPKLADLGVSTRQNQFCFHEESAPLFREIIRIIFELRDDPVALEEFGRACGEAARARLEERLQ